MRVQIGRWAERMPATHDYLFGGIAVLVGVCAGLGVWVFKQLIGLGESIFGQMVQFLQPFGHWTIMLSPIVGGLLVGAIAFFFIGVERYHGVAGIMEAVALAGGRLRYWRMPYKVLASAISIGSGASVGPEDPSVQIGANLGSLAGQGLRFSDERTRTLVAAGAAAGVAAAFNAPIAGVFFAVELIIGELSGSALGVIVLTSVAAAVTTQALAGADPAFVVLAYQYNSPLELPFYLGLGLVAGPVAALYVRMLYWMQDIFHAWRVPRWVKTVTAGAIVGAAGIFLPQVMGVGYPTIERLLSVDGGAATFPVGMLLLLALAKLVLTPVSIGGGFYGGVFAPALFIGATLGAAYGTLVGGWLPGLAIAPPSFAMVGMGAVLAGAVHAPLTAILLLFELTNDYRIILPIMFAVSVSFFVSRFLQADSVYTLGLARHGVRIQRGRDVDVLAGLSVGEVMQTEIPLLREENTLEEAADMLLSMRSHGLPVVAADGRLTGVMTVQDIERAKVEKRDGVTVGEICTRDPVVAFPDETLAAALQRMSARDIGRLPVVARTDTRRLVGWLRRSTIISAYDIALSRRAALHHRGQEVRLGATAGFDVTEVAVTAGSACAGKRIGEIAWPRDCVIATVRRGSRVFVARGDTLLRAGDLLIVVAERNTVEEVQALCR